jgi:hypothetical protein
MKYQANSTLIIARELLDISASAHHLHRRREFLLKRTTYTITDHGAAPTPPADIEADSFSVDTPIALK